MSDGREMTGVDLIAAERQRQLEREGYASEHDDRWDAGELARAAACYAMPERLYIEQRYAAGPAFVDPWPWYDEFDKRKQQANYPNAIPTEGPERLRMLVKAGALIAAEIDRLARAQAAAPKEER